MNAWLMLAAALMTLTGLVHSLLGEQLIFRRMRRGTLVPAFGGDLLQERNVRILWATWHLASVLGWGVAAALLLLADPASAGPATRGLVHILALASAIGALLVMVSTRGRHPGWIALSAVATACMLGTL